MGNIKVKNTNQNNTNKNSFRCEMTLSLRCLLPYSQDFAKGLMQYTLGEKQIWSWNTDMKSIIYISSTILTEK